MLRTCPTCGEPTPETYCSEHQPSSSRPSREVGYDAAWDRLSRRARRLQPWCIDCGATSDLTTDHLPSAWERKAQGLPIRLVDVEVCCRSCNSRRGAARTRGETPKGPVSGARRRAKSPSQIEVHQ